ncbi:outer membrane beta-barrel protein [Gracilimonas sp.]|uniref:outer membrane beta-barrel protein n=1 Tax=Gracilimonas sp. TaxID=1974203 RepID=UPI0028712E88|nr:porin family protein [Gracilimonas sp.]
MTDKNNENDPLEQFFRDKAEEFDIEFREKDWQDLEKRLDHKQTILSYKRKTRLAAAAAFLIFSVLGYFIYNNANKINDLNRQISQVKPTETTQDSSVGSNNIPIVPNEDDFDDIAEHQPAKPTADSSSIESDDTINTTIADVDQLTDKNELPQEVPDTQIAEAFIQDLFTKQVEIQKISSDNSNPVRRNQLIANASANTNYLPHFTKKLDKDFSSVQRRTSSRFSIGITGSPDLSTVSKLSNFDQPGYKFGLNVGYAINSQFTISTGIIQSKVRYNVNSQGYDPYSVPTNGSNPSQLFAECIILDIPINLEYNFREFNSSRFFLKTGVSTYIMLNEDYRFNYDYPNPGQIEQKTVQSGKAHFMSNIGFSLGYELDIHKNFSLRAEPFIKVPVQNVGWGNVKLYSVGTFVSVQYRL